MALGSLGVGHMLRRPLFQTRVKGGGKSKTCNRRVNVELAAGRGSRVRDTPREHSQTFSAWALQ